MKKYVVILLHLGYWMMYLFMVFVILEAFYRGKSPSLGEALTSQAGLSIILSRILLAILPALIGFYSFYAILFEKFLAAKKIIKLLLAILLIIAIAPVITETIVCSVFNNLYNRSDTVSFYNLPLSFIALVNGIIGLVMKGFISWYADIKVKVELNQKNHETELALMKAQLEPHFLFNTINNIDVLILKDPNKASQYLNKLSDMMRFMLYETKTDKITLEKELSYIEKYIDLQKIRSSNSSYVNYEVKGSPENLLIEPMLFIPFIENAFKHAENKKKEDAIKVSFVIEKDKIRFECENTYSTNVTLDGENTGIGNELIKRRLDLLYPHKHTFELQNTNGIYKVILSIDPK